MYSPMESFINYNILNQTQSFNNINLYQVQAALIIQSINQIHRTRDYQINNNWQIVNESLYRTVLNMIESFIGVKYAIYLPIQYTIFYLIFFSNFLGLVPYSSTPTVELVLTLSLAFTLLFGVQLIGILNHQYLLQSVFLPAGTPQAQIPLMVFLEIIAYIFRTISQGLRLAINLITGHVLSKVCVSFIYQGFQNGVNFQILLIPIVFLSLFLSLEIQIAYLQAYIFLFITCQTIKDII